MRAKALLDIDRETTLRLAKSQHIESLNLILTSDLKTAVERRGITGIAEECAILDRLILRYVLRFSTLIHIFEFVFTRYCRSECDYWMTDMRYANKGYEANRRACQYFYHTRMMSRRIMVNDVLLQYSISSI